MKLRLVLPVFALLTLAARAYPPAPDHTIFGTVRDEVGRVLARGSATVIVNTAAGEVARCPIELTGEPGVNYTLRLPMDSGTIGELYRPTALLPTAGFTIRVVIGTTAYVPIQVSRIPPTIGQPGQRTRLDLTLGIDSDGDGLPDAWEQLLIDNDRTGRLRTLADVRPGDDLDGDGLTNLQEFLLGTYALDPADGIALSIVEAVNGYARLRFATIAGRTYTVRASTDLKTWTAQTFATGAASATPVASFRASDITLLDVWVPLPAGGTAFYRLYAD
jgi:hypothetical protein